MIRSAKQHKLTVAAGTTSTLGQFAITGDGAMFFRMQCYAKGATKNLSLVFMIRAEIVAGTATISGKVPQLEAGNDLAALNLNSVTLDQSGSNIRIRVTAAPGESTVFEHYTDLSYFTTPVETPEV